MTRPDSLRINPLLDQMQKVVRLEPDDVRALCRIGGELAQLGRAKEAHLCYRVAVDALRRSIRGGDANLALQWEDLIYATFVKNVEDEEHYQRCFADWKDDLAALGRQFSDQAALASAGARRVAFVLHSGHRLGHTEMLLKMLESRPRTGDRGLEPRVYILNLYDPAFVERLRAAGVEVVRVVDALGRSAPADARFLWLRERFKQDRVGVCVWVSVPTMAAFALSMRLAPVQIFWSMRFHPISAPYIDGYITWGASTEKTRRHAGQEWQVVPLPFALEGSPPRRAEIENLRRRFPERVLLGTLAREEKINSEPFLQAVADILAAHPHAGFLWTGRVEHPGIAGRLRAAGIAERCHFVGWVDTQLYAAALDIFLETFPVGSGVTSYQAFAAGVPLLSYLHPQTIFGTHYWHSVAAPGARGDASGQPRLNAPDEFPILCARDTGEYVTLAERLISDTTWRAEVGARGRAFFEQELRNGEVYASRLFETIYRIAAAKLDLPVQKHSGSVPAA
jgi:glycosyltransferase involved in cell wall biosynthesis